MGRKRQSKLTFSPVASSSAAASAASPSRPPKRRRVDQDRVQGVRELEDTDSDVPIDRSHGLPTPKKSFQFTATPSKSEVERSMKQGMPVTLQKNGMFANSSDYENLSDSSTEASESESEEVKPPKKTGSSRKKTTRKVIEDEEDEESDQVPTSRRRSSRKKNSKKVLEDEEDDESEQVRPSRRRSGRKRATKRVSEDEEDAESEEVVTPKRRSGRSKAPVQVISDDEEEVEDEEESEDEVRRKGQSASRKQNPRRDIEEQDDLESDLAFLKSSPPPDRERSERRNKPMNARQKALEALKRKRGNANGEPSSSATPGRRNRVVISSDSDSDSDLEVIDEVDSNGNVDSDEVQELSDSAEAMDDTNAYEMFQEDGDDANFIDDDAEDLIGAPAEQMSMPLEFSSLSRAKPRELFKFAVDWMVQKKINPAFSSSDPIYNLTFKKLDDEVNGLANSKYSSSVWTADFTRSIRARPEILVEELSHQTRMIMNAHCEACNRKTHIASFNICFHGKPYNKETLEPVAGEDASSDSDSSISGSGDETNDNGEKPVYDATGELIPPESRIFAVGSTCSANAQMAHTLHHWRYHLNSWVLDYLVRKGHCTAEKLVERDRWSTKKRAKYAVRIVKEMDQAGEITKLHKLYKDQVKFATEAKNEYKAGWGRR